ncbi:hypothetical protein K439DRAFT_1386739 [Ramaria rubella]|nr:hypothetical protein K439DRAFT_1386739 [Ramaria rubella]
MSTLLLYVIGVSLGVLVFSILSRRLQQILLDKLTAANDLILLGKQRPSQERVRGTAVIAGASIAGLLAARVCSDHFESVLVVDPEPGLGSNHDYEHYRKGAESDEGLRKRARVPQYTAPHAYQLLTFRSLKNLFPDFENRVRSWGGRLLPADFRVHVSGRPISPPDHLTLTHKTMFISRYFYESLLRYLVTSSCPNICFINGTVTGVIANASDSTKNRPLESVIIRSQGSDTVHPMTLLADCTGPVQSGLKWLENAGYALLPPSSVKSASLRTTYNPNFCGTSCHFHVPPGAMRNVAIPHPEDPLDNNGNTTMTGGYDARGFIYLYIPDPRRDTRNFLVQRVEGDWLQIVCSGYDIPDRPTCVADIKAFVSEITPAVPIPSYVLDFLDVLENTAVPKAWHFIRIPPLSFVKYHEAHELPSNFVALGDATCQLNPIHGQGVTMSTICAVTLNAALASNEGTILSRNFSQHHFNKQASRLQGAWDANKSDDYGFSTTTPTRGETLSHGWFRRWYGSHLLEIASKDGDVATILWYIESFLRPATDVFSPSILRKVAWNWFTGGGK